MRISQGQSDYQALMGACDHTGPDGSRPIDRAYAAGYGSGAIIFISENIACLPADTPASEVVAMWAGSDPLHLGTLVKAQYRNIGAGVTELDGTAYFTLDVGVVAGGRMPTFTPAVPAAPGSTPQGSGTPLAISEYMIPVRRATPLPNGKTVHLVQSGQTLWAIAIAYGIKIADLVRLNNLEPGNPMIYMGQKLLVRSGPTATVSPVVTLTRVTPTPAPTIRITATRLPEPPTPPPSPTVLPPPEHAFDRRTLGIGLVIACGVGLLVMILLQFKRSP
jgi:LysM repeat protein